MRVEARIEVHEAGEGAKEETGGDDKGHAEGDFGHDQNFTGPVAAVGGSVAAGFGEAGAEIDTGSFAGGEKSEEESGGERENKRNEANGGVEMDGIPESKGMMTEIGEAVQGELPDDDAEDTASGGEQ